MYISLSFYMLHILKLASIFEILAKKATLKDDYIKRILMGYGDFLGVDEDHAWVTLPGNNKRKVNVIALRSLIGHAKKILKYGIAICMKELTHLNSKTIKNKNYISYINIYNKLKENYKYNKDDFNYFGQLLNEIVFLFEEPYWSGPYGGNSWAKIAETLLKIYEMTDKSLRLRSSGDFNAEAISLMELMTEINTFEGLAHNTDSILYDMVDVEKNGNGELSYKDRVELNDIMLSKEFEDPKDVINNIAPYLRNKGIQKQDPTFQYIKKVLEKEYEDVDRVKKINKINEINKSRDINSQYRYLKGILLKLNKLKNDKINNNDIQSVLISILIDIIDVIDHFKNLKSKYYDKIEKIIDYVKKNYKEENFKEYIDETIYLLELIIKDFEKIK